MAIFNIKLNILDKYKLILNDIIYLLTIIIVFQYLSICDKINIKNVFKNGLFNDTFISFLIFLMIGVITYYLIVLEIINIY
tara:strand:- start:159 stop:401 length:243 start_codon:yes stop_codon:yes gene_type:complete